MSEIPITLDAISGLLKQSKPAFQHIDQIQIERLTGGVSNLTYRATAGSEHAIVRLPPAGRKAKTAHNMVREARMIQAIGQHYPYCPEVLGVVDDAEPSWFAMEEIVGVIARRPLEIRLSQAQAKALCRSFVTRFVELHSIDIEQTSHRR